ncbi:MAG: hypothetical protein ABI895_40670 [Deltaproteobacteria bacterium]
MRYALIDSSVYVDLWTGVLPLAGLDPVRQGLIVRHSAVVLSELQRGARTRKAIRAVQSLKRIAVSPWVPSADEWWKAGRLVKEIGDEQDWEIGKRREFQNDALIALSARTRGAVVITRNRQDFTLLSRRLQLQVVLV